MIRLEALQQGMLEAAEARDAVLFAERTLGFCPDSKQREVLGCGAKRLLLNCSRQWGKSTTAAVMAAHAASTKAGSLVVCVSPTQRQSGELVRKIAAFLGPIDALVKGNGVKTLALKNGSRVVGLPGSEATVRGFSAPSLVIIDEAARVVDGLYKAVRPMLATGGGRLVCLSTPFGERGFFWKEWTMGGEGWTRVSVRGQECERIPAEFLEEERRALGEEWFAQEYECSFGSMGNVVFRREWLERARLDGMQYLGLA